MRKRIREFWTRLKNENASPTKLGFSVFAGLFLGIVPLYGIQTGLVLLTAYVFRLNRLATLAAAQISMPWFAPFLIAAEIALGEWMRYGTFRWPSTSGEDVPGLMQWTDAPDVLISCLVGSFPLGLLIGGGAGLFTYWYASRDTTAPVGVES